MRSIIVVFPKKENAVNIRNILVRNGIDVTWVCTTGAQAVQYADTVEEGIIVCGYKMQDMLYTELRGYLPDTFEILLIASPQRWDDGGLQGVVGLPMPIKVFDLINTMEMMMRSLDRRRKKRKAELKNRNPRQQALVEQAKELLTARNHMTEEEAHYYLQKCSMDSGSSMTETAQMILSIMAE
ncbi:ANTAR domain-containing protein [Bariatricus massiliensis]|uniref:ANTAR domain-containing protein n=1 Tax=Bariatricus massiliensis TaxID=1745713 RepID=A0ABS8DEA3_9FIRM|nr:ANTAR domain-containing protein [Bariatricus massiliensis]MCB7302653.1 ANTAR domain-containing protein [Bariatricus massiliensis]MCB7373869.1 ANTAR domain-containing protein [Bariatricus massiliensis]MCB7386539.1 ANTAR domain-containing protein [Bariatricus massiliensis]MCB7410701.1 ANTAR domain-containing protein [Bariatricus massiliensis]MCQ5253461.1 ANTAR domain-containing protein [Bariatricus massiliensis]